MTTARGAGRPPGHGGPQGSRGAAGHGAHGSTGSPGSPGHDRGQQPPHGDHGPLSYPKAFAILVVAVILGAYLLSLNGGHGAAAPPATTTSTTSPPSSTTTSTSSTTATASPSKAVKVLVANASHTTHVAHYYSSQLTSAGWGTLTPVTATTVESTSTVYYAANEQPDAEAIASALHVPSSAVQALGSGVPVSDTSGADVVVVVGEDLAGKVPASVTTSTAG